jgi:dTDP-glucose pyrophosphorylase
MHVRKAIIPATGLGTRFLPATHGDLQLQISMHVRYLISVVQ